MLFKAWAFIISLMQTSKMYLEDSLADAKSLPSTPSSVSSFEIMNNDKYSPNFDPVFERTSPQLPSLNAEWLNLSEEDSSLEENNPKNSIQVDPQNIQHQKTVLMESQSFELVVRFYDQEHINYKTQRICVNTYSIRDHTIGIIIQPSIIIDASQSGYFSINLHNLDFQAKILQSPIHPHGERSANLKTSNAQLIFQAGGYRQIIGINIQEADFQSLFYRRYRLLAFEKQFHEIESLSELRGLYLQLCKSNPGSRKLQKLLEQADIIQVNNIFSELSNHLEEVLLDSYGNYVFQKLIKRCDRAQRLDVLTHLKRRLPHILKQKVGTHALQSILNYVDSEEEIGCIWESIQRLVLELSMDDQATHFIQKLAKSFFIQPLVSAVLGQFPTLAQNKNGVVVIKSIMHSLKGNPQWTYYILTLLYWNFGTIATNEYAHYLLQEAYQLYGYLQCAALTNLVIDNFVEISNDIFGSSLIQKLLNHYSKEFVHLAVSKFEEEGVLLKLMNNKPGSYVIHRILDNCDCFEREWLEKLLASNIQKVGSYFSKVKWAKFMNIKLTSN